MPVFEPALHYIGRRAGISVHPHQFRPTLAQGILETTDSIKVAQDFLGHSHLSTTADLQLRVDQHAMVTALAAAKSSTERATMQRSGPSAKAAQYVFDYDDETISELEHAIAQASDSEPPVEILDGSAGVCTHIMPRKSRWLARRRLLCC
jgi:integrase/recombinase XerD